MKLWFLAGMRVCSASGRERCSTSTFRRSCVWAEVIKLFSFCGPFSFREEETHKHNHQIILGQSWTNCVHVLHCYVLFSWLPSFVRQRGHNSLKITKNDCLNFQRARWQRGEAHPFGICHPEDNVAIRVNFGPRSALVRMSLSSLFLVFLLL